MALEPRAHSDSLAPHLSRTLARLRFALAGERAAVEMAAALGKELDAARTQIMWMQADIDGLHDRLASRQDFIDVLTRRARARRSSWRRLARLWRSFRRSWRVALSAAVMLALLLAPPHLAGR